MVLPDTRVPYWPAVYGRPKPEAAEAAQFWLTPEGEAALEEPEAG